MQSEAELRSLLSRIDHRGYPAYKDTKGQYRFPGYVLSIDHVQGDPFASPSKVSVLVSGKTAGFPQELYCGKCQRIALQDELLRQFGRRAERFAFKAKGFREKWFVVCQQMRTGSSGENSVSDSAGEWKYPS